MKKWIAVIAALFLLLIPCTGLAADANYVIEDYRREITVNENNTYVIEDTMTVDFLEPVHGLRVDIPVVRTMKRISNGQVYENTYNVLVSNMHADQPFETDREGNTLLMKIGDADTYVSGEKTYQYGFTDDMGDDGIGAFDEFYYDLIAPLWAAPIEHFSFEINMP